MTHSVHLFQSIGHWMKLDLLHIMLHPILLVYHLLMEPKADGGHGGHGDHGMHASITMSPNGDKQKFLLEDVEEMTIIPRSI
jgi:hypothetical protein